MKGYARILMRMTNTPLAICQSKLEIITENVLLPLALGTIPESTYTQKEFPLAAATESFATVNVFEALSSRNAAGMSSMGTSYTGLQQELSALVASGQNNIVLLLDSPGGEVTGLFSLSSYLRSLVASGVTITAVVDGMACSAAYALAAACTSIVATPTSILGSIGAIMVHLDQSVADASAGLTYTIFRSKSQKALGDSHTPLNKTTLDKFQAILDNADTAFNLDVLASRPSLTLEAIVSMKGSEFIATEALSLGLVDKIVPSVYEALANIGSASTRKKKPSTPLAKSSASNLSTNLKGIKMENPETEIELRMALAASLAENAKLTAEVAQAGVLATTNERARVLAVFDQTTKLNLSPAHAIKMVSKGYDADMSLDFLTTVAASIGAATSIDASGQNPTTTLLTTAAELNPASSRLSDLHAAAVGGCLINKA
jgi:ClpP class serine protease